MNETAIYELLLSQQKQIRELKLHLEALKRMMFEHRPPFVPAFEHQLEVVEESGLLKNCDQTLQHLERPAQGESNR